MNQIKQPDHNNRFRGPGGRTWIKDLGMGLAALVAVVYLLNPDAGILELIPDNIPVIGNLDEVAATLLLVRIAAYFGWRPFTPRKKRGRDERRP